MQGQGLEHGCTGTAKLACVWAGAVGDAEHAAARAVRMARAGLPLCGVLVLFPVGLFLGAVTNVAVIVCKGNLEGTGCV